MSGSGSTYYSFVTEFEKSQIETRLKTFVDNVKIIICKTITNRGGLRMKVTNVKIKKS